MSKLIGILIILVVGALGYSIYNYYQGIESNQKNPKEEEVVEIVDGNSLPGMDYNYEDSLRKAKEQGFKGMKEWLRVYGAHIQDPRKAWIELDYVILLGTQDPAAAKKLFQQVKDRTLVDSPVYPRIKKLSNTYE